MYEVGQSDPNSMKPREFKHPYYKVPFEGTKSTYD